LKKNIDIKISFRELKENTSKGKESDVILYMIINKENNYVIFNV